MSLTFRFTTNVILATAALFGGGSVTNVNAGNVTVKVARDSISVLGDRTGDSIRIVGTANGSLRFIGENGTTINGQLSGWQPFTTPAKPLLISMGGGDDSVIMRNVSLGSNDLSVDLGIGSDLLDIDFCDEFKNIRVLDGPSSDLGNDSIRIKDLTVSESIEVLCGAGNDAVGVGLVTIGGDLIIRTGEGNDFATAVFCEVADTIDVLMGAGDDFTLVDGLTYGTASFLGGNQVNPHPTMLNMGPLEGDVFMTLDFSLFVGLEQEMAFEAAIGYEHEYSFLNDIMNTELEDAVLMLLDGFDN